MAGEVPRTGNAGMNSGPRGVGRTFLVGGSIVAGGLLSFYYSMLNHQRREQAAGRNPYHEQVTGHLTRKWDPTSDDLHRLQGAHAEYSNTPPAYPATEHNSGHMTIETYNKNRRKAAEDVGGGAGEGRDERKMIPPPQRGAKDGSGKAYTKSPDYAKNYEKTREGKDRRVMPIAVNL